MHLEGFLAGKQKIFFDDVDWKCNHCIAVDLM